MMESLCSLALVAWMFSSCAGLGTSVVGYVEGEFVHLAPIEIAQIREVVVRRGDRVEAGSKVATMETSDADIALRDAAARLAQSEAELANLQRGRRPEEIAVLEASLASAQAQARDAQRVFARRQDLFSRGISSQADFDQAQMSRDVADARVRELAANLDVARLPARENEILAAQNRVVQARANLDQARWRLGQRQITALAAGRVTDVIRRVGEVAGPSAPVVTMLPEGAVRLKIYVPERLLSAITIGKVLTMRCDGCANSLQARISYISREPEFTPPVIYSADTRQKLVYLVEARPEPGASGLQPGQIVDVRISGERP